MDTRLERKTNVSEFATAYYLLEGLNEIGIDYLFCNFGTDHAPIIEAMAAFKRGDAGAEDRALPAREHRGAHGGGLRDRHRPRPGRDGACRCRHRQLAMAMHNLCRARMPVLLMAGKAPYTTRDELVGTRDTYVHFVQEPFDQASLVRPYTKWEYDLPSGVIAKEALRRAHTVMQSEPARAGLSDDAARDADRAVGASTRSARYSAERFGAVASGGADPEARSTRSRTRLLAARESDSDHRLRRPQCARRADDRGGRASSPASRVFEGNPPSNISHDLPCFAGFAPDKALPEADVGLLVDVDVPWFPSRYAAERAIWWAHIDVDVLKRGSRCGPSPATCACQGDSGRILDQLLAALKAKATPRFTAARRARVEAHGRGGARGREPGRQGSPPTRASPARSIRTI